MYLVVLFSTHHFYPHPLSRLVVSAYIWLNAVEVSLKKPHKYIGNFVTLIHISTLYLVLDDSFQNIELRIVCGSEVKKSTILEEQLLHLITLMDDKIHITPITKNKVRYVNLIILLWPYQGIQDAVPVLLETLNISGKQRSIFITHHGSHRMFQSR